MRHIYIHLFNDMFLCHMSNTLLIVKLGYLFLFASEVPYAPAHILQPVTTFTAIPCSCYLHHMHQSPLLMLPLSLTQNFIFFLFCPTIFHFTTNLFMLLPSYSHHPKNMASSIFTKRLCSTLLLLTAFSFLCMPKEFSPCYFSLENHISYTFAFILKVITYTCKLQTRLSFCQFMHMVKIKGP